MVFNGCIDIHVLHPVSNFTFINTITRIDCLMNKF